MSVARPCLPACVAIGGSECAHDPRQASTREVSDYSRHCGFPQHAAMQSARENERGKSMHALEASVEVRTAQILFFQYGPTALRIAARHGNDERTYVHGHDSSVSLSLSCVRTRTLALNSSIFAHASNQERQPFVRKKFGQSSLKSSLRTGQTDHLERFFFSRAILTFPR